MTGLKKLRRWASGVGATLCVALIASAMIVGVGALQVARSYDDAMTVAYKAVAARGRSITKLTDSSLRAVDLVLAPLAEELTDGAATKALPDLLDRRVQQLDQVSALVVSVAGRRWLAYPDSGWAPIGVKDPALAWHRSHPEDSSMHVETVFDAGFPSSVAIVLSRSVRDAEGRVSGVVAAVLRPGYFETLYAEMIVGPHGAIALWRDDGSALLRYPPAPSGIGRDLSPARLKVDLTDHASGIRHIRHSVLDGLDRLIDDRRLAHFPFLVVATSSALEDVVAPWRRAELAQVAAIAFCVLVLVGIGVIMARHRRREAEAARLHRADEALFRGVFDQAADNLFVYRVVEDGCFLVEAINPAAAGSLGISRADIVGRKATEVLPPRIASRANADLNATIAAREVVRFESEGEVDGRRFFNEVVQVPLFDADGVVERVFVGARDVTHLKTFDARLSDLNARLVLAERIAHVGHWRLETPSDRVVWSDEVFRIHGLEPSSPMPSLEQALGAYHPDDRAEVSRLIAEAIDEKRDYEFSLRIVRPCGEIRHVTARCLLEFGPDGELSAIFGTLMDVTDLKQAERRLEEQSTLLQTTLAHMEQGLVMFDALGGVLVRNARAVELLGDALGVSAMPDFGHDPSGRRFEVAGRILDVRSVAVTGGGAVMTYTDVTDLLRAEKGLRESEARYRLLAENTSELIQLGHDDGRRSYISPAIERLLGFTVDEFAAMRLRDYVHPDDLQNFYVATRRLGAGSAEVSTTYRALHKTKGWIWVEGVFRRIADARGDEPTIVGTFRDVGERRERAEELKRATELAQCALVEAERASAAKTEFLASMSHEIRTPLSGVLGYTELLLDDGDLTGPQRRNVERIQNAGTALLTVVNDILDFSRIEAGRVDLEPAPFHIEMLVDNAVSIVRSVADRKRLSIAVTIDPGMPRHLVGDQDRLRQILLNLLNNAVKFTPSGGIIVKVVADGRTENALRVRFSVVDTGIGIPVDKRRLLFERFSQVDGSIARQFGGTGLGLAISKSLVGMMGGEIGVESAAGHGSTFWFVVPLAEVDDPAVQISPTTPPVANGRKDATILLVDDLEINRDLARAVLVAVGHEVDAVGDGAEAILAVQARRYDLVLMDMQMPGMDGVTATSRIRSLPGEAGQVPIIAMTANVLPDQIAQCRRAGMDDHVGKPVRIDALRAIVERHRRAPAADADSAKDAPSDFDLAAFGEMRGLIGADAMRRTLDRLAEYLKGEFAAALLGQPDTDALSAAAHKVVSMAGTLGFMALSSAAGELGRACAQGSRRLDLAVGPVVAANRATIERIDAMRIA